MSHNVPAGNRLPLETRRLVLRPLTTDEVDSLHRISFEPLVRLYCGTTNQTRRRRSRASSRTAIACSPKRKSAYSVSGCVGEKICSAFAASFASKAWRSRSSATI